MHCFKNLHAYVRILVPIAGREISLANCPCTQSTMSNERLTTPVISSAEDNLLIKTLNCDNIINTLIQMYSNGVAL